MQSLVPIKVCCSRIYRGVKFWAPYFILPNFLGYYVQVNTEEEARQRVIEYALVMARPMVLYQADHPIHWSPVFVGGKSNNMGVENESRRRLVTTVSTPVYDRRNHSIRVANLLGVVGTDVPIEDIKKMVPQYKVLVNLQRKQMQI